MIKHIHVFGPSGSGTTTLGKTMSKKYNLSHFDADDYFWLPTTPPYQKIRNKKERQELLFNSIDETDSWVISGSFCGWGDVFIPYFDLAIYLWVPTTLRIKRLEKREWNEFGQDILPGGIMHQNYKNFIKWASEYDYGGTDMRSKKTHELWMSKLDCRILRIEGDYSIEETLKLVDGKIKKLEGQG